MTTIDIVQARWDCEYWTKQADLLVCGNCASIETHAMHAIAVSNREYHKQLLQYALDEIKAPE